MKLVLQEHYVPVWIPLNVASTYCVFNIFHFFFLHVNSNITWFYCVGDKKHYSCTVYALFMGPTTLFTHLKIILLPCFQFSIFSFSNNKFNPNWPYIIHKFLYVHPIFMKTVYYRHETRTSKAILKMSVTHRMIW